MKVLKIALAAALCIGLVGCGPSESDREAASAKVDEAEAALEEVEQSSADLIQAASMCRRHVSKLIDALENLDSILSSVGLNFEEYGERVNEIVVAYGKMPINRLGMDCIAPAVKAEKAMNAYISANQTWQECFEDFDCSLDSVDFELQLDWMDATDHIKRTKRGLQRLSRRAGDAQEGLADAEANIDHAQRYVDEVADGSTDLLEADRAMQALALDWAEAFGAGDIEKMCDLTDDPGSVDDEYSCKGIHTHNDYAKSFEGVVIERSLTDGETGAVQLSNDEIVYMAHDGEGWKVASFGGNPSFAIVPARDLR